VGMPISVPSFLFICLFFYSFAIFILFKRWRPAEKVWCRAIQMMKAMQMKSYSRRDRLLNYNKMGLFNLKRPIGCCFI
jgi:hypothetical protein